LYKTGTSLLASQIEDLGYFNPASESNKFEKGHGSLDNYYLTKECKIVRHINQSVINKKSNRFRIIESDINLDILNFLDYYRFPLVLKDPLFVYTLNIWLYNVSLIGYKPLVYFTFRNEQEMINSWMHAYHTRGLYKDNKEIISKMKEKQIFQINYCRYKQIPYSTYSHKSNFNSYV